ncbi:MAG: methyltransferase domain-containing protein [Phycisphaerales bacterium]|nr:MAG: methyltransferase domain-containing protein [Phycisphaerales bacterium]
MTTDPGYLDPYLEAVRLHGCGFASLLWRSPEYQIARFRVLAEVLEPTGRVIADLGCGRADLAEWMEREGIPYGRYIGVEAVPELAGEAARRAAALPEASILTADFAGDPTLFDRLTREHHAEAFVFSGSLNTFTQHEAEGVLDRAWRAIARVRGGRLVFNFLSDQTREAPDDTGPARRFETLALTRWALARTPSIILRHDYLCGHDATIAMLAT